METVSIERNIQKGNFVTQRNDRWWTLPFVEDVLIIAFIIYTVVVMLFGLDGTVYKDMGYVSPIFGINILPASFYNLIGWPEGVSTAWLFIWAPLGFRASCYYERKLYYRGFFANPPACGVTGVDVRRGKYTGERALPFILNNFHRYFFYATFILMILQTLDVLVAVFFYGIGVGTILMAITAVFLSFYVYGCHAFRHAIGGKTDCYDCGIRGNLQYKGWRIVTKLNEKHNVWFWCSLIMVMVVDFYIHLVVMNPSLDFVFFKF